MKFYGAHPFDHRKDYREWELRIESEHGIEILNPFYDGDRTDIDLIDSGQVGRYEKLLPLELVTRDLMAMHQCDAVLAIINGDLSYGTIMEIVYAKVFGLPIFIVCSNGHHQHPWLQAHARKIYPSKAEFELDLPQIKKEIEEWMK